MPARSRPSAGPSPVLPVELERVYRQHAGAVYRWAAHLGGPAVDPEDIVHEVFLLAHARLRTWRADGGQVSTWLYRVTAHLVRRRRRREAVRRRLTALWPAPEAQAGPAEAVEQQQSVRRVYRVLDRLPERYRTVLVLFELEGLPGEEIAALTGAKVATVWVQLHRARELFLEQMRKLDGGLPWR